MAYRIVKNVGGKKLWRIWRIYVDSPKFFLPIYVKTCEHKFTVGC